MPLKRLLAAITALAAISPSCLTAHAQDADPSERETIIEALNPDLVGGFDIDVSIPDAPGFAIIGASPTTVIDPGSEPISFATLSPFLDEDNNLKTGFAIGGTPYWWFNRPEKLADYRLKPGEARSSRRWQRIFSRTSVSAAFVDGGDDKTDKLGFGLTTELLDGADYRLDEDLYTCAKTAYTPILRARRPSQQVLDDLSTKADQQLRAEGNVNPTLGDIQSRRDTKLIPEWRAKVDISHLDDEYRTAIKKCQDESAERRATKASWTVAAAVAVDLDNGDATDWQANGGAAWTSFRMPFQMLDSGSETSGQKRKGFVAAFGKYAFDQRETAPSGEEVKSDAATAALSAGFESLELKASGQVGYQFTDYQSNTLGIEDDDYGVYSLSVSKKIGDGMWLKFDIGSTGKRSAVTDKRDEYLKLSIAYDFGQ